MFQGGDADTEHPEEYQIEGVDATNYEEHWDKVMEEVNQYKKLQKLLDCNDPEFLEDDSDVEKYHGVEMARLFDLVPRDPQNDYQFRTSLSYIQLVKYDNQGNRFTSETL